MSLPQTYPYYGYNPYSSVQYQYYPSQNITSLPTYSYVYSNPPYSVSNTTLNPPLYSLSSKPKNSNTLFVKNLPFEMSSDEAKKMFEKYGEVAFIKSQIHDKGMAFITFYDMRSAEKAYEKLHGTDFSGRHLVVDFSFKKNNQNNSSISLFVIIEIHDYSQSILLTLDIIKNFMASYGEIYNAYEMSQNKYVVQYYDFRCSQSVARQGSISINGVKCDVRIPDEDPTPPTSQPAPPFSNPAPLPETPVNPVNSYSPYAPAYGTYNAYQQQPPQVQPPAKQPLQPPPYQSYQPLPPPPDSMQQMQQQIPPNPPPIHNPTNQFQQTNQPQTPGLVNQPQPHLPNPPPVQPQQQEPQQQHQQSLPVTNQALKKLSQMLMQKSAFI